MNLKNKTILITGGTGSFGRQVTKRLLSEYKPKKIIIFSRDEYKQYIMRENFSKEKDSQKLRFFLGDVRDRIRLMRAFDSVDVVIHAAALKQVPALEYNPRSPNIGYGTSSRPIFKTPETFKAKNVDIVINGIKKIHPQLRRDCL